MALILASILALMAGSMYAYFQRIQIQEMANIMDLQQVQFFDAQVQQDMDQACSFGISDQTLQIRDCPAADFVQYRFAAEWIVREDAQQRDTFALQAKLLPVPATASDVLQIHLTALNLELHYQSLPYSRVHEPIQN